MSLANIIELGSVISLSFFNIKEIDEPVTTVAHYTYSGYNFYWIGLSGTQLPRFYGPLTVKDIASWENTFKDFKYHPHIYLFSKQFYFYLICLSEAGEQIKIDKINYYL